MPSELQPGPEMDDLIADIIGWAPRKFCAEMLSDMQNGEHCGPLCIWHDPGQSRYISDCARAGAGISWEDCPEGVTETRPNWSTDDAASIEVRRWIAEQGCAWMLGTGDDGFIDCSISRRRGVCSGGFARDKSEARATARAFIEAFGKKEKP